MYSRSPNSDELEVGKKVETGRLLHPESGGWRTAGRKLRNPGQGPVVVVDAAPLSDAPHYAAGKWGMRDRAEVKDGRLLPPVCTEAQGSRQ